ncbi:hypothetical protein BIY29_00905 [Brenneria alni]|uniref:Uncharacterized protein n=1 Tax=Brenneria alni TaxID=71656 RepID=A0A421DUB0_9GAMM|nr:hypothetical protein [Brenneria alni]RLM28247.1 hypothetical protein BIY29_00905 [Brenneria alni]
MPILDATTFPLVWVDFDASGQSGDMQSLDDYFQRLERLISRDEPFVMLSHAPRKDLEARRHDKANLKPASRWMKQHKQELKHILALIIIEPSPMKRYAGQAIAALFGKFWGYPLLFTATVDDARILAMSLLANVARKDEKPAMGRSRND